ncbi:hypothetical protein VTN00DRAFT_5240 [Thermoascus crustaceus]|uniref:uncharacterized protein n=1 Tax=Thermoascus crustaceus TaxID=5088 RepID=UPI003742DC2F
MLRYGGLGSQAVSRKSERGCAIAVAASLVQQQLFQSLLLEVECEDREDVMEVELIVKSLRVMVIDKAGPDLALERPPRPRHHGGYGVAPLEKKPSNAQHGHVYPGFGISRHSSSNPPPASKRKDSLSSQSLGTDHNSYKLGKSMVIMWSLPVYHLVFMEQRQQQLWHPRCNQPSQLFSLVSWLALAVEYQERALIFDLVILWSASQLAPLLELSNMIMGKLPGEGSLSKQVF